MLSSPRLLSRGAEEGRRLLLEPSSALPVPCPHGYRARRRAAARGPPVGRPRVGRPRAAAEQVARRARAPCEAVRGRTHGRTHGRTTAGRRAAAGPRGGAAVASRRISSPAPEPSTTTPRPRRVSGLHCRAPARLTDVGRRLEPRGLLLLARLRACCVRESRRSLTVSPTRGSTLPDSVRRSPRSRRSSPRPPTATARRRGHSRSLWRMGVAACAPRRGGGLRVVEAAHGSG